MGRVKEKHYNELAGPLLPDDCYSNYARKVPEEQADASRMTVEAMEKMLFHHQRHNRTSTRDKYIRYWKEQIAYKILLEEVQDER